MIARMMLTFVLAATLLPTGAANSQGFTNEQRQEMQRLVESGRPADKPQIDVCNVREFIKTNIGQDGPLTGCNTGDTAHFQIDASSVAYASVVARYCDLGSSVVVEQHPDPKVHIVHLVCRYQWKWSKEVTRQKHPDQK